MVIELKTTSILYRRNGEAEVHRWDKTHAWYGGRGHGKSHIQNQLLEYYALVSAEDLKRYESQSYRQIWLDDCPNITKTQYSLLWGTLQCSIRSRAINSIRHTVAINMGLSLVPIQDQSLYRSGSSLALWSLDVASLEREWHGAFGFRDLFEQQAISTYDEDILWLEGFNAPVEHAMRSTLDPMANALNALRHTPKRSNMEDLNLHPRGSKRARVR